MEGFKQIQGWENYYLDDICSSIVRGPFGGALKKDFFVDFGYKVYEQKNAIYQSKDIGSYYIDENKFRELKRFIVETGDFIVSCSGTIGCIYQIPVNSPKGIINQALLKLKVNQRICSPNLFYYIFKSKAFQEKIIDSTQGGAMKNLIGMSLFKKMPFLIPSSLPEQEAIAKSLSDVDSLIDTLERKIAKKRNIKQGAMQRLLTGKQRLPGFSGDWVEKKLGDVCQIFGRIGFRGYTKADIVQRGMGAITLSPSDIVDNKVIYSNCTYISWKKYHESPEIMINNGDIIFVKTASIGKVALIQKLKEKATLNPQFVVFKNIKLNNILLFNLLINEEFKNQINAIIGGSTIPTMSQKLLESLIIFIPPTKAEQSAIAQILTDMDNEITTLEQKLDKYKQIKQGMMQELLTGRIRLVKPQ